MTRTDKVSRETVLTGTVNSLTKEEGKEIYYSVVYASSKYSIVKLYV